MILSNLRIQRVFDIDDAGYARFGLSVGTYAWRIGSTSSGLAFFNSTSSPQTNVGTAVLTLNSSNVGVFVGGVTMAGTLTGAATLTGTNTITSAALSALVLQTGTSGTALTIASATNSATFTGAILASTATAGNPSYAFTTDATKGFYHNTANQIGLSISGVFSMAFAANGQIIGTQTSNYIQLNSSGAVALVAAGSNQSITLTPSGVAGTSSGMVKSVMASMTFSQGELASGFGYLNILPSATAPTASNFALRSDGSELAVNAPSTSSIIRFTQGGTEIARFAPTNGHFLVGGLTVDGSGYIQLPSGTTAASGITFGNVNVFQNATNQLTINASTWLNLPPSVKAASGTLGLYSGSGANAAITLTDAGVVTLFSGSTTTALTLDASQVATFASDVFAGTNGYLGFASTKSRLYCPTDGNLVMRNSGGTGFSLLQFGGTTSSFPSIKRSTTSLLIRLADDSAYAGLSSGPSTVTHDHTSLDAFTVNDIGTGGKTWVFGPATGSAGFGIRNSTDAYQALSIAASAAGTTTVPSLLAVSGLITVSSNGITGASSYQVGVTSGQTLTLGSSGGQLTLSNSSVVVAASNTFTANGPVIFSPAIRTSGTSSYFTVTTPADTGQTTATESIGVNFATGIRTWADGTVAIQREHLIAAPTYNKTTTAATFTKASTFTVSGAPIAGTGVTITNAYALWVQAGNAQFDGGITTTTTTVTSQFLAPVGSAATPSYSFTGGTGFSDKGFYSSASGELAMSIGGVKQFVFTATGAIYGPGTQTNANILIGTSGSVALNANGTNQNITLTPSGTGSVIFQDGASASRNIQARFTGSAPTSQFVLYSNSGSLGSDNLKIGFTQAAGTSLIGAGLKGGWITDTNSYFIDLFTSVDSGVTPIVVARATPTGNLLLGGLTSDGTGRLQFPTATTSAGGITFGTDTFLYRIGTNGLGTNGYLLLGAAGTDQSVFFNSTSGPAITSSAGSLLLKSGATVTALTFDTSQNAAFVGTVTVLGTKSVTGTTDLNLISTAGAVVANPSSGVFKVTGGGAGTLELQAAGIIQNTGANSLTIKTNGTTAIVLSSTQIVTFSSSAVQPQWIHNHVAGTNPVMVWQEGGTSKLQVGSSGGVGFIGTLTSANLLLQTNNTTALTLDTSQNATIVGNVTTGAAKFFIWNGQSTMGSASNGVIALYNNAQSDFSRLQLGGTTSSFPSIKRSAAILAFRLADDSADAGITASTASFSGAMSITDTTASTSSNTGSLVLAGGLGVAKALYLGSTSYAQSVLGVGDIALSNGTITSPGIHFYIGANTNMSIDATTSNGFRFVYNLDETGPIVLSQMTGVSIATAAFKMFGTTEAFSSTGGGGSIATAGGIFAAKAIITNSTTDSSAVGTGSLFTAGGAAIAKSLYLGGIFSAAATARASGVASYFTVTTPADTGITASTESIGVNFVGGTRVWADGTVATQREFLIHSPVYQKTTTSATFTKAATFAIEGPPNAGIGVTLTNPYALWVQLGNSQFDGPIVGTGTFTLTTQARTNSPATSPYFSVTIPTDTSITAATEAIGVKLTTGTRTWATTGTVALQREVFLDGPTYASAGASQTFTDAFTLYVTPPVAGTNAIFTRKHTLGIVDSTTALGASTQGAFVVATTLGTASTSVSIGGGYVNAGTGFKVGSATLVSGALLVNSVVGVAGSLTLNSSGNSNPSSITISDTNTAVKIGDTTGSSNGTYVLVDDTNKLVTVNISCFLLTGNRSAAAYTTTGAKLSIAAASITDTSSSGTVAVNAVNAIGVPTLLASSATVYTASANLYVAGNPISSTNVTQTNSYGIWNVGNSRIDGGQTVATVVKSANYAVTPVDYQFSCNSATPFTFTMIAASANTGKVFKFKNKNAGAVTIDATAFGQIYDRSAVNTVVLNQGDWVTLTSDGSTWLLEGAYTVAANLFLANNYI